MELGGKECREVAKKKFGLQKNSKSSRSGKTYMVEKGKEEISRGGNPDSVKKKGRAGEMEAKLLSVYDHRKGVASRPDFQGGERREGVAPIGF